MIETDFLFRVLFPGTGNFLGTFIAKRLRAKILVFLMTIIAYFYVYLTIPHEVYGTFYKGEDLVSPQMTLCGIGHFPKSVVFKIKLAVEDKVIAEGIELREPLQLDERRINGKLFKLVLLSKGYDNLTIHLTNEVGYGVFVEWKVKYDKLHDFLNKIIMG